MFRHLTFSNVRAGVLVVFALATCAVGASIWRDRSNAIENGTREARNIATVLGGQIARSIQAVDIVLRETQRQIHRSQAWPPSGPQRAPALQHFRDSLLADLAELPQALQIVVTDARGQVLISTASWPAPEINVADREYFQDVAANDDDRLSVSLPFRTRISGELAMVLARRIKGPDGAFLGVVFTSVKRSYFESIYRALDLLPGQTFLLLRPDGTILIRYPDGRGSSGTKIAATDEFRTALAAGGGSYRAISAFDKKGRWVGVYPLPDYPLVVNSGIPEEVLLRDWRARAILTSAATLVLLACAVILLSILGRQYRRLSASEASLAEKTQALERHQAELVRNEVRLLKNDADLRTQNQRFDAALNNMSQGLAMFDGDERLVVCNEGYRTARRLSPEQAKPGRSLREIVTYCAESCGYPPNVDDYLAEIRARVSAGKPWTHEIQHADGRIYSILNDPMPGGGWVVTFEDVTDRRASEKKIKRLVHSDLLTGIANRVHFLEQIDAARDRLRTSGHPFNVMMLDLDHFKRVNDSLGHAAGDALLMETALRLKESVRSVDVLARLGGDEFAIIQTPPRDFEPVDDPTQIMRESAISLANRIIELVSAPYHIDEHEIVIGASIGIATAPNDGVEPGELMQKADLALYSIKAQGRNGYSFFDAQMAAVADQRHKLEEDLRAALSRGEFELYYQPMIDVATRQPCGMEALVRWHHPDQGLIAPDRFIALAEDIGLVSSLGEWILQTACADAAAWPDAVRLAINISPVQFRSANLLDVVMCALVDSGLSPERLEVEITERVLLENDANYLSTLHQMKNLGVSIALDDFGTGYSSLSYLKMFPFDKIKIDRSFTGEVLERPDCAAIVCAVINLGRSLDIATVAEGVETQEQFQALRAAGVTQAQGYLFGRPRPAAQIKFDAPDSDLAGETVHRQARP